LANQWVRYLWLGLFYQPDLMWQVGLLTYFGNSNV
jgi:hypothetical protein